MTKAKMPVSIRPNCAGDFAAQHGLWAAYLDFYGTALPRDIFKLNLHRLWGDDPADFFRRVYAQVNNLPTRFTHQWPAA